MASKRAKTIETAWIEAGMEISGDVNFVKKGWKTFVVSFRYKANAQQPSVREGNGENCERRWMLSVSGLRKVWSLA